MVFLCRWSYYIFLFHEPTRLLPHVCISIHWHDDQLVCTFYHNGTDLRPVVDPEKNICSWLVSILHNADTSTNIFPSVHVFNSIGVHIAIAKSSCFKNRPWVPRLSFILAVSICISTVVLKQHSVVDGLGSVVMSYALYPLIYGENYAASRRKLTRKALS